MSADIDALDRGLIEVALTAAQAMVRIEKLEAKVAAIFRVVQELAEEAGYAVPESPAQPHLEVVR